jgi:hypothetical protein
MRKWIVWLALLAGGLGLFHYEYKWRFQFLHWLGNQTEGLSRYILPWS